MWRSSWWYGGGCDLFARTERFRQPTHTTRCRATLTADTLPRAAPPRPVVIMLLWSVPQRDSNQMDAGVQSCGQSLKA